MNKCCVYTCITGDYDSLNTPKYIDKNFDYICFTNNKKITSNFWKIIYISDDLDNLTLARKLKILGHEKLDKYDLTIWLDGSIDIRKPLSNFLNECCDLKNNDMVGFAHHQRDCIYEEMAACVYLYKENLDNANRLYNFYKKEKYPEHNGLIESAVLVRKNNIEVKELMKLWFEMLAEYSRRDQLIFNYCLWKKPIKMQFLNMNIFDNKYFIYTGHKEVKFSRKYRVYFNSTNDFINMYENKYETDKDYYVAKFKIPVDCQKFEIIISPYDYILLKEIKTDIKHGFKCDIVDDLCFFFNNNFIVFEQDFKKGDLVTIKFKFEALDFKTLLKLFDMNNNKLNGEITKLNEHIKDLNDEIMKREKKLSDIYNSKGYKLLNKFYKAQNLFRRK